MTTVEFPSNSIDMVIPAVKIQLTSFQFISLSVVIYRFVGSQFKYMSNRYSRTYPKEITISSGYLLIIFLTFVAWFSMRRASFRPATLLLPELSILIWHYATSLRILRTMIPIPNYLRVPQTWIRLLTCVRSLVHTHKSRICHFRWIESWTEFDNSLAMYSAWL